MEKPGREKEVRGKKRDGQQRKEKEKDGNGKNERIYPLENILFDTNIGLMQRTCHCIRPVCFRDGELGCGQGRGFMPD